MVGLTRIVGEVVLTLVSELLPIIVVTLTILGAAIYYAPKIIDPTIPELKIFEFAEEEN